MEGAALEVAVGSMLSRPVRFSTCQLVIKKLRVLAVK